MFTVILSALLFVVGLLMVLKKMGVFNGYEERFEQEKKKLEQEIEDDDLDFLDEEEMKAMNFLLIGLIGTVLFLVAGFFTGNSLYFVLTIFIITAVVYLILSPPRGPF